jgi:NAD(P)H-dependent flavin oxidoreductase YrpB (nitropropane dioxygenase family)
MEEDMRTAICELLGIDLPLLAFSHCRDVVAAVSRAGGFGVFGASSHAPDELDAELTWIDEHTDDKPYGVDIVVPQRFEGKGEHLDPSALARRIPDTHRQYVDKILSEHGIDSRAVTGTVADDDVLTLSALTVSDDGAQRLLDISFAHPIKLIANALGVPPAAMLERGKAAGVPVAALVGTKQQAVRQVLAGVDIIVAQGTEAGGHCGEITTMVLVPEVIEAIRPIRDVPVLAAGGIVTGRQMAAAIALGAAGAWTGSVWLTTAEAETAPFTREKLLAASSSDTVRSKARTGKPARQLRSDWTEAWSQPGAPEPLPMPLQPMLSMDAIRRIDALAAGGHAGAQALATTFVGQGVGLMTASRSVRDVVFEMAEDFGDAVERLNHAVRE